VGHGIAKVVVPVGAVETKAAVAGDLAVGKIHDVGDVGEIIVGVDGSGAAFHFGVAEFDPDVKGAGRSATP